MAKILFLDDMYERHRTFWHTIHGRDDGPHEIHAVWTAEAAIKALDNDGPYDQVFLDHDLSEDDIMIAPEETAKVPTGMTVVNHIMQMKEPPPEVIVHSCNPGAAQLMFSSLLRLPGIKLQKIAFPWLIQLLSKQGA